MNKLKKQPKHIAHLSRDPVLGELLLRVSLPKLELRTDHFVALARSIVGQQLSTKAAQSIWLRFLTLFKGAPTPKAVLKLTEQKMRAVGLSFSKIKYIKNLAQFALEHPKFPELAALTDAEIIELLTEIKGIGRWTAEMFLIFALGREDVFSNGDLGLRNAVKRLYKLRKDPSPEKLDKITKAWSPYRSHAARVLWKSLDNE